tara:strand:+ start:38 stop:709 length:672 start_codon:yes stop_codon:yes gene_type:complete
MYGIITYDCPHKKTIEIIERCSDKINCILTIPFAERKKRKTFFNHRPYQFTGATPQQIGKSFGIEVFPLNSLKIEDKKFFTELVVGGAGILSDSLVNNFKVVNAHPGLIPTTRGLDAFKWAIYFEEMIGVTIHQINEDVDFGLLIHHSITEIEENDDIETFANRHFKNELNCICDYILGNLKFKIIENLEIKESRMRMNFEKEMIMIEQFNKYKKLFISKKKL